MLKSNLFCAIVAFLTAVTISSAFAKGYLSANGDIIIATQSMKIELKKIN